MHIATLALIIAAGFIIMTPIGPVSTMCIRRTLMYGPRAGMVAGAGDAAAVATYATIGVTCSALFSRFFAPFAAAWHLGIAVVLVAVAILIWRSRPLLPKIAAPTGATLFGGFAATLALALANPADIVVFAALFEGLRVVVQTPAEVALFCTAILLGGCAYWVVLALVLDRYRGQMTTGRMVVLNRAASTLMVVGAGASLMSIRATG